MASQDSSPSPPPLHSHRQQQPPLYHQQQPPLHHHHQQPPHAILMGPPPQQSDITSYPIMPYQHQQQQQVQPQSRYPFNSVVTDGGAGEDSSSSPPADGPVGFSIETGKKKRGRPRKTPIDAEGASRVAVGLSPAPGTPVKPSTVAAVWDSSGGGGTQTSEKRRGRPPGSVKRQIDNLGSSGMGFTPHVLMVNAGEDIASKIVQFTQQGPRTVCILSANGSICNCTLRLPGASSRNVSYEGNFEIVSLLGSFMLSESTSGVRVGGLTVLLAGPDGRVLGGGVAGRLIAAAQVQVIVGSFMVQDVKKPKLTPTASQSSIGSAGATPNMLRYGGDQVTFGGDQVTAGASPPSAGGAYSYSSEDENNSETNNGGGSYDNSGQQQMQNIPMYGWESSSKITETTFPDEF